MHGEKRHGQVPLGQWASHDLSRVQELLAAGDDDGLKELNIGSKDVSSFFMLPTTMIGREQEHNQIVAS